MEEFRDGILIFNLEDEVVWKKLNQGFDDAKGKTYFEGNRGHYMTQPRLALTESFVYSEQEAKDIYAKGKSDPAHFDSVATTTTQRQGYRERRGKWDLATEKNSDIVAKVLALRPKPREGEMLEPFAYQAGFSVIRIDSVDAAHTMSYEEAKSEVQGDYIESLQKQLQKEWLDSLRLKYHVKIDDQAFRAAVPAK